MKIKQVHFRKFFEKTCSLLANFSLFLHIFLPYLAAIPVTNVTLLPEEENALLTGTPSPEELATSNEEGTVLGTIDTVKSFLQKSWLPLALGLIGLFAIIRYVLRKQKKSSY